MCKKPLERAVAGSTIVFPPVKSRIFKLIVARPGVTARELAGLVYERQDETALASIRVHICQMREMLRDGTDMKIGSYAGTGYWVEHSIAEPAVG